MIDDQEHQHDGAESAGHDVEEAEVKGRRLPLAPRHGSGGHRDQQDFDNRRCESVTCTNA